MRRAGRSAASQDLSLHNTSSCTLSLRPAPLTRLDATCQSTFSPCGRRTRALRPRHAPLPVWPLSKNTPVLGVVGKRGARPSLPIDSMWRDVRAPPAISVPARSASADRVKALAPSCGPTSARPAHPGRSARRGTLGRNLPGPWATLARDRRRRFLPACHRRDRRSRGRNWDELYGRF